MAIRYLLPMNKFTLISMAFFGGVALAIQGALNSRLGTLLRNPLLASVSGFLTSLIFAILIALVTVKEVPSMEQMRSIPPYLWFLGGLFSVIGLTLYYFTIPRLGVSTMISLALCGQLITAAIAAHFGWFHLPVEPLNATRLIGIVSMGAGIVFMNIK